MCRHSKFLSLGTMCLLSVPSFDHLNFSDIYSMILAAAFFAKHRNTQNGIGSDDVDCGLFFSKKIQLECHVAPLSEWTIYTHIYTIHKAYFLILNPESSTANINRIAFTSGDYKHHRRRFHSSRPPRRPSRRKRGGRWGIRNKAEASEKARNRR